MGRLRRRNPRRAWSALSELYAIDAPPAPTLLLPVLHHLLRSLKRLTLVVIVSDFLIQRAAELDARAGDPGGPPRRRRGRSCRTQFERRLPEGSGFVRVRDLESGDGTRYQAE